MSKQHQYNVIVIGAGAAGLAAAQNLHAQGIKEVLVIEARDRIGGRVWTTSPWGAATDMGASWIHTVNNNPITALAKKYHVHTVPTIYSSEKMSDKFTSFATYDSNGNKIAAAEIQRCIELLRKFNLNVDKHNLHLKNNASYADAVATFAKQENLSAKELLLFNFFVEHMIEDEFAADLDKISIKTNEALHTNLSGEDVLPEGGYIRIFQELAKNIDILLHTPVTEIKYNSSGVIINTEKGVYNAKYVIITLPLGVLQSGSVKFAPELPAEKLAAIKNLRMGVFDKIYMLFNKVFWDPDIEWIAALPNLQKPKRNYEILNLYKYTKQPILLFFTAGSFAVETEKWSDQEIVTDAVDVLKLIFSNDIPSPTAYLLTRWNQDPYARGSYSYPSLTSSIADYKALAAPVANRLFFAGEATSENNPSTVHGAYLSGIAAAEKIRSLLD